MNHAPTRGVAPRLATGLAALTLAAATFGAVAGDEVRIASRPAAAALSPSLQKLVSASRAQLAVQHAAAGLEALGEPQLLRAFADKDGSGHVHWQSTVNGVPVWGGDFITHHDASGLMRSSTAPRVPALRLGLAHQSQDGTAAMASRGRIATTPQLTAERAIAAAQSDYGCTSCYTAAPETDLWVLMVDDSPRLAWRVRLRREDGTANTAMPVRFIDATDGRVLMAYDNLQTASTTGTGVSLYSGTVSLGTYQNGSTYYMEDTPRKIGTFDFRNGTSSIYRLSDTDNLWDTTSQKPAVDAQYAMEKYYDFMLATYGRNGIDGSGGPAYVTSIDGTTGLISGIVHYSSKYNNAFWNGQYMTYGDGDGTTFTPLVSVDVTGHEMTHGVTERTANLTYSGESGALNEAISDIFGSLLERYVKGESSNTWRIGEDIYTPGTAGDALRYMDNPHLASNSGFTADDDPDHYSERYTGTSDNGGVHINSGIANKAFYLLAKGGTHHLGGSMTGIGADDAGKIWYKALTTYMTSSTNFAGARTATLNAAAALFPPANGVNSTQYNATCQSWALVGVGSCSGGGTPPPPTGSELYSNGGFEGSASPTVLSGANAYYVSPGNYPHGGSGYIYFGTVNNGSGAAYQQISIPSTATGSLSFWLNVTSDETTTSTAYDKLFVEVRDTSGTLLATLATYSNVNKSTAGSYAQKSLSLASYKGQTVRIQFRGTTDSSLQTTFRVDDVSVK